METEQHKAWRQARNRRKAARQKLRKQVRPEAVKSFSPKDALGIKSVAKAARLSGRQRVKARKDLKRKLKALEQQK